jgi:hypothetical protein
VISNGTLGTLSTTTQVQADQYQTSWTKEQERKKELYVSDYRAKIENWLGKETEDAGMLWWNHPKWEGNFIAE